MSDYRSIWEDLGYVDAKERNTKTKDKYPPFMTGSRVYGNPRPYSDYDLVILLPDDERELLAYKFSTDSGAVRAGELNLILVTEESYGIWREARDRCLALKEKLGRPLTKDEALQIHTECGIPRKYPGSGGDE